MTAFVHPTGDELVLIRAYARAYEQRSLTIPTATAQAAKGLRMRFYNLKKRAGTHAISGEPWATVWHQAEEIELTIQEGLHPGLVLRLKADSPAIQALEAALGTTSQELTEAELEESAKRVLEKAQQPERSTKYYKR